MKQEIQEIIEKNLPKQVGETLRKRLEEADKNEQLIKDLTVHNLEQGDEIIRLKKVVVNYEQLDDRNTQLDTREKELNDKERNLKIAELTYMLDSEKAKSLHSDAIAMGLVRNTTYRKNVFDNETNSGGGHYDANNNYIPAPNVTKSTTEDKSEE
jgi:hypothetical protein